MPYSCRDPPQCLEEQRRRQLAWVTLLRLVPLVFLQLLPLWQLSREYTLFRLLVSGGRGTPSALVSSLFAHTPQSTCHTRHRRNGVSNPPRPLSGYVLPPLFHFTQRWGLHAPSQVRPL